MLNPGKPLPFNKLGITELARVRDDDLIIPPIKPKFDTTLKPIVELMDNIKIPMMQ